MAEWRSSAQSANQCDSARLHSLNGELMRVHFSDCDFVLTLEIGRPASLSKRHTPRGKAATFIVWLTGHRYHVCLIFPISELQWKKYLTPSGPKALLIECSSSSIPRLMLPGQFTQALPSGSAQSIYMRDIHLVISKKDTARQPVMQHHSCLGT